ncbi:MAG TPA: SDR family NAD(P)-dependent oxidoreductase [Cyclobacteriaceae bacterium]|nr:SDR family NAD(P)-dependent oxidoreductase [Cyclobacteriaceae bacterium]
MKKAIVVGASSGIGKELALILANNGYQVGITGRRTSLLQELQLQKPDHFVIKSFDVTKTETVPQFLQELVNELGTLDLLVLSSGTGELNKSLDFTIEKGTIDVNVSGFTCVADWAFNYFWKQKSGHFVNISSVAGIRGSGIAHAYNASKAFQINYLEGLRQKVNKIRVPVLITDIRPGFVKTDMAKGPGQFWVASVEKAASQIFDAILKKRKVVYITKRWRLIAILLKLIPRSVFEKM